jgi:hypothetical protein
MKIDSSFEAMEGAIHWDDAGRYANYLIVVYEILGLRCFVGVGLLGREIFFK